MANFDAIIADLRRRAWVDQRVSNGLRVRRNYVSDRHTVLSYWHLTLAAGAFNQIRDIRGRPPKI